MMVGFACVSLTWTGVLNCFLSSVALCTGNRRGLSQGQIFLDNFMCCHTEIETVGFICYLTQ